MYRRGSDSSEDTKECKIRRRRRRRRKRICLLASIWYLVFLYACLCVCAWYETNIVEVSYFYEQNNISNAAATHDDDDDERNTNHMRKWEPKQTTTTTTKQGERIHSCPFSFSLSLCIYLYSINVRESLLRPLQRTSVRALEFHHFVFYFFFLYYLYYYSWSINKLLLNWIHTYIWIPLCSCCCK